MFTGLIEETCEAIRIRKSRDGAKISVRAGISIEGTRVGDSIAVNGICLTVTEIQGTVLTFDAMNETLGKSALGNLRSGEAVNLERAVSAGSRLGGHLVSGHVDGTGTISAIRQDGIAKTILIRAPRSIVRLILPRGSVAIDGVSLTVCSLEADSFGVSIIPHTAARTTITSRRIGDRVNIECDIAAKGFLAKERRESLSVDFLRAHGFLEE